MSYRLIFRTTIAPVVCFKLLNKTIFSEANPSELKRQKIKYQFALLV
jgi:hypothetical protein